MNRIPLKLALKPRRKKDEPRESTRWTTARMQAAWQFYHIEGGVL